MATLIVTNLGDVTADDGQLTLREAITLANGTREQDSITFAEELAGGTLVLTQGQLEIFSDLTIDGDVDDDGRPDVTINAAGRGRVIKIFGEPWRNGDYGQNGLPPDDADHVTMVGLVLSGGVSSSNFYGAAPLPTMQLTEDGDTGS